MDIDDPKKPLTVTGMTVDPAVVRQAVEKSGFHVFEEILAPKPAPVAPIAPAPETKPFLKTYYPLILIFSFISVVTLLIQWSQGVWNTVQWMNHFMAGFFLVFSFFKLLNLKGFADAYQTYDVVAKRSRAYAFAYPFIELGLGLAYLVGANVLATNLVTLVVMGVSSIGVIQALLKKRAIECACLGTIFNLPMTKITLFEDLLMAGMALGVVFG